MIDIRLIVFAKLILLAFVLAMALPALGQAPVPQVTAVQYIVPIDVVQLVQVTLTGIAAIGGVVATIITLMVNARSKRTEATTTAVASDLSKVKEDVKLVERNTNSISTRNEEIAKKLGIMEGEQKGKAAGAETARVLAEGQSQGRDNERDRVASQPSPVNTESAMQAATAADTAAAAIAAPAAAAIAAPPAAAIAAPPAAEVAAPPVVKEVVPPAVQEAVKAAFEAERNKPKS